MRRVALWAIALGLLVIPGHAAGGDGWTPLGVAHQSPLRLLFLQLAPEPPTLLPSGGFLLETRLVHTNTSLRELEPDASAAVDLEQFHPSLVVEYGLSPRLQVGAELPFLYSWEGFLDPVIHWVEERTGNLRFVRKIQPRNGFDYVVEKNGKTLMDVKRGDAGIGDLAFKAKGLLLEESTFMPAASIRAAVKFPTGEFDRGLGSGHPDVAVGFILGKRWGPVGVSLVGDWTKPLGNPFAGTGISVGPWVTGTVTVDVGITDRLSLFGLLRRVGSPYRSGGLHILTQEIWETAAGFTIVFSRQTQIQIGFVEDLFHSAEVSSDITLFVNVFLYRF